MDERAPIVFFDIGATLGRPRLSGPPIRLIGLEVYPFVPGVLADLKGRGLRLGIISNTGSETTGSMRSVLEAAGLYRFFDPGLLIYSSVVGMEKNSPTIFRLAAERAERSSYPDSCLFVGEDSHERSFAQEAGWKVAPHPLLVREVLDGNSLRFLRIHVPRARSQDDWRALLRQLPLVPLHVSGEGGRTVHAIASQSAVTALANAQFEIHVLGDLDAPAASDLYLLRDDLASSSGFLSESGQSSEFFARDSDAALLVASSNEGLIVQVPADRSVEEFHFHTAEHGHNLKLSPDPGLLAPPPGAGERDVAALAPERDLTPAELIEIETLDPARIQSFLDRYTGTVPLGDAPGTPIDSRHILNPGNRRAAEMLAADLRTIGGSAFSVSLHSFMHEGRSYFNVEAELAGVSDKLVLVTAHLDSTAAFSPPYSPATDPAPGADDDASGVSAVLAAAETIRDLAAAKTPEHTIRFVLFNAEEHGLIGSHAYARDAAAAGEAIEAVFQMDMIGYNVVAPRTWEVHAGYLPSASVQAGSVVLAERVKRLAPAVSPALGDMQLYQSASAAERDPAEGRSDHAAFQRQGYHGCVATEDFFAGPDPAAPSPEGNPNYHRAADTFVDLAYAAEIARCIVAAAWVTACPSASSGPDPDPPPDSRSGPKVCCGSTVPGATDWKPYGTSGIYLDVDTSTCGFDSVPRYITSLGGRSSHWATTGATSIYRATSTGFRVYLRWSNGGPLTVEFANRSDWHLNWLAIAGS